MLNICEKITTHVGTLFTCSPVNQRIRVRSPFMYPDGDYIDVFVKENPVGFVVSDLGETNRWLRMQAFSSQRSPKQKTLIQDICITHGVEWLHNTVIARAKTLEELPSDLWFTIRQRVAESVIEDVAAFLTEANIQYDRNEPLVGRSQKSWRIDFYTRGARRSNLIEVLSTGNRAAGQTMLKTAVTIWHDLSYLKIGPSSLGFITLFDDTTDVWSQQDFSLIEDLSEIVYWSRPEKLLEYV
jgi:Domain of unknown function DUF1828